MQIPDRLIPEFPEGTPEYEAYAAELRAELAKFANGEPPYDGSNQKREYLIGRRKIDPDEAVMSQGSEQATCNNCGYVGPAADIGDVNCAQCAEGF